MTVASTRRLSGLLIVALFAARPVLAQVKVDPLALNPQTAAPAAAPGPAKPRPPAKSSQAKPAPKPVAKLPAPEPMPAAPPPGPEVPAYAPVAPALPPLLSVPLRPAPPLVPPVVVADAPGEASTLGEHGLRVLFGAGRSEINPAVLAAVKAAVQTMPAGLQIIVTSFAPPQGEDTSGPRRLSLARALNLRNVLLGEGVASPRVIIRAMGGVHGAEGDGPIDRADLLPGPPVASPVPPVAAAVVPGATSVKQTP